MSKQQQRIGELFGDGQYLLALLLAPVCWLLLYNIDTTDASLAWVFTSPWLFLSLVLVQPVLEEIVFRGALQGWLMSKPWAQTSVIAITWANILTSLVFMGMHFLYHQPLMALLVFLPSLVFGYVRDRYDGWLLPSMGLHCFYNLGYFFLYTPNISAV